MTQNLLEQLSETEIPSPPIDLNHQVHQRLNGRLLMLQLVELAVKGFPYAVYHFFQALLGLFCYSLTGRYEFRSKRKRR